MLDFWQVIFAPLNMNFNSMQVRVHKSEKIVSKFLYEILVLRNRELNTIGVKKVNFLSLDSCHH